MVAAEGFREMKREQHLNLANSGDCELFRSPLISPHPQPAFVQALTSSRFPPSPSGRTCKPFIFNGFGKYPPANSPFFNRLCNYDRGGDPRPYSTLPGTLARGATKFTAILPSADSEEEQ